MKIENKIKRKIVTLENNVQDKQKGWNNQARCQPIIIDIEPDLFRLSGFEIGFKILESFELSPMIYLIIITSVKFPFMVPSWYYNSSKGIRAIFSIITDRINYYNII